MSTITFNQHFSRIAINFFAGFKQFLYRNSRETEAIVENATHLTGLMQLLQDALQFGKVVAIEIQFAEFRVRLEPEPIVFGVLQCIQRRFVEVLQQFHLDPTEEPNLWAQHH